MISVKEKEKISIIYRMPPVFKLVIGLTISAIVFFIFPLQHADSLSRWMLAWDVFSFCLLSLYWLIFYTSKATHIRRMAAVEDTSRVVIFIVTLICTTASMFAVILLLTTKHETSS